MTILRKMMMKQSTALIEKYRDMIDATKKSQAKLAEAFAELKQYLDNRYHFISEIYYHPENNGITVVIMQDYPTEASCADKTVYDPEHLPMTDYEYKIDDNITIVERVIVL